MSSITGASFQLIRKISPLLISVLGHAVVIAVLLFVWRSFKAGFQQNYKGSDGQVFEIEIVSPETLDESLWKQHGGSSL